MRVILTVSMNELNQEFIELLQTLLNKNAEIIIRKESVTLEEYDRNIPLEHVMQEFSNNSYSPEFLADLERGLKTSSVYT